MGYDEAHKIVQDIKKLGSGFIPQPMRNFSARQTAIDKIALTFLEPRDTVIESQTLLKIKGVIIRMKEDGYPKHKADGTLIIDNTELGRYADTPLVVDDLQLNNSYYFAAFPYSDMGIYNEKDASTAEVTIRGGESVTVNVAADSDREFSNIVITLHNVTSGDNVTQTLTGAGAASFNVNIGDEYYIEAGAVSNYRTPQPTQHFTAEAGGSRVVQFDYVYLMEVMTATLHADDGSDVTAQRLICHNVTTGQDTTKPYSSTGVNFTIAEGEQYYITATEKDFYSTPKTATYTAIKGNTRVASLEYVYDMEKVNVVLTAESGGDVSHQTVICHNVTTGEETEKPYSAAGVSFMIPNGNQYYITADELDFYDTPRSETYTAIKGNTRAVALNYVYIMEKITVTLSADDGSDVSGQQLICHNVTTGQDTTKPYNAAGVSFMVRDGQQYYVTASNMELYATPKTDTYTAVKGTNRTAALQYMYAPAFADCSVSSIKSIIASGQYSTLWEIGDKRSITLTTGEEIEIAIADFDHDELSDGNGKKAPITLTMVDALATRYNMNSSDTNVGGWTNSAMRARMDTILNTFPQEWREMVKTVKKKTSAGNKQSTISNTDDKLFLFSEVEIFGSTTYSFTGEGTQYPYYATAANRIKKQGKNGSACGWWERSPYSSSTASVCRVGSNGNAGSSGASDSRGLAGGFCI